MDQKPSVGRIVHYVHFSDGEHLAAIITRINEDGVSLEVFSDDHSKIISRSIKHVEPEDVKDLKGDQRIESFYGTWHWPERV